MDNILCSVITVCYNSERTIERTIRSVLNQSYKNIEYIIVDGASSDHTLEIIKRYEPEFHGKMRWLSEPDGGIYFAMNKGIALAKGELIGMLNSDDYYEECAVETMVGAMTKSPYQILYGMTRAWVGGVEESISILFHNQLEQRMIWHPACFVTARLYADFGMFDTEFISAADYDFMLRMSKLSSIEFKPVYKLIVNYTNGGMSATSKAYYDLLKVQRKHNLISPWVYKKTVLKCKTYDFIHRIN